MLILVRLVTRPSLVSSFSEAIASRRIIYIDIYLYYTEVHAKPNDEQFVSLTDFSHNVVQHLKILIVQSFLRYASYRV